MEQIDERKVRLYQWLLKTNQITEDRIPEIYKPLIKPTEENQQ